MKVVLCPVTDILYYFIIIYPVSFPLEFMVRIRTLLVSKLFGRLQRAYFSNSVVIINFKYIKCNNLGWRQNCHQPLPVLQYKAIIKFGKYSPSLYKLTGNLSKGIAVEKFPILAWNDRYAPSSWGQVSLLRLCSHKSQPGNLLSTPILGAARNHRIFYFNNMQLCF